MLHLGSIMILLLKIFTSKSCRGISLKTQLLYCIVFVTRYLDLFWNFISIYNWVMKVIFISTSCLIVYLMKFKHPINTTYDPKQDNFVIAFLIIPCFLLALVWNEYFIFSEVLWAFSIYLEAVAIIPQLIVVHRYAALQQGFVENLTSHYVVALGGYRAMYLVNWIYRIMTETGYRNWIVWVSGVVQTAIYCDFFYYYASAKMDNTEMKLPI